MKTKAVQGLVSVVIPVYNEKESLKELYQKIVDALVGASYKYEIIFIDDGSNDGSPEVEESIAQSDPNVIIERFNKNKGKAAALNRGFQIAKGEYVVTIDADLQDDPYAIPDLIKKLKEGGYDLVSGWKQNRQDKLIKRSSSRLFNFTTRVLTGVKLHDMNNGLKVYKQEVVKNLKLYGEMHRFIPVLAKNMGYVSGELKVRHFPRRYGKTKYGVSRFYKGFLDLLTVLFITRFMKRPMHFFGLWGILLALLGLIVEIWVLILKYGFGEPFKQHFALLILGVLLLVFGIQFFSLGLIGEMITYNGKDKEE